MRLQCSFIALFLASAVGAQDMPLSQIVIPGEGWKKVEGKFQPIRSMSSFSGPKAMLFLHGEDNELHALLEKNDQPSDKLHESTNQPLVFNADNGFMYAIVPKEKVIRLHPRANFSKTLKEIRIPLAEASAWTVTRDKGSVAIADAASKTVWMFRIDPDGGLSGSEKYMTLRVPSNDPRSEASAMCLDNAGRFLVATKWGVQVFDPTGRLCGVLLNPSSQRPTAMTFGGEHGDVHYLACGAELYRRKMQEKRAEYAPLK